MPLRLSGLMVELILWSSSWARKASKPQSPAASTFLPTSHSEAQPRATRSSWTSIWYWLANVLKWSKQYWKKNRKLSIEGKSTFIPLFVPLILSLIGHDICNLKVNVVNIKNCHQFYCITISWLHLCFINWHFRPKHPQKLKSLQEAITLFLRNTYVSAGHANHPKAYSEKVNFRSEYSCPDFPVIPYINSRLIWIWNNKSCQEVLWLTSFYLGL